MAQYPSDHESRPRHSTADDVIFETRSEAERNAEEAYRGHRVVDDHHRPIGKVTDVIYDETGIPKWAVVSPGVFRAEHFLPLDNTYLSLEGNLVVPFDKRTVSRSPKAERDHILSPITERALEQYYQLAA
ncbi:MAG TPA: PRC-barrel domain-containing protein [Ilumatobacteraceae bacterium]|nr:PRC-barrel domain-containing protein [Ilumatobacteraceae bacterium]